ncbi:MAG TPA: DUF4321 domain-containing protein [bacterium]|nr:DUF4321 domain-containing protein [bacterium]HPN43628.1 DUF4321 domain-containing protein [bacterium]
MRNSHTIGRIIIVIFLGAIVGGVLGEVIALLIPDGIVREFFLRSVSFGFSPATINLILITFTLGFTFKLNIIGVIGIFLATYIMRWYS